MDHAAHMAKTGYWGKQGAGLVFFCTRTKRFCLSFRSSLVAEPHTWSTWGGAMDEGEEPAETAVREAHEETGLSLDIKKLTRIHVNQIPNVFTYTTFVALVNEEFEPHTEGNWEVDGYEWCKFGDWPEPLHKGMKQTLTHQPALDILEELSRR
jgi:8-oxo-dGTP diphosphatase